MFKKITIHLRGPICACDERRLSWNTSGGDLHVSCETCGTQLAVPQKTLLASFDLETPYPGGGTESSPPLLKVLDGGKVLHMMDLADSTAGGER